MTRLQGARPKTPGSTPGRDKKFISQSSKTCMYPTQTSIQWVRGEIPRGVKLTTHPHLVIRLRMSRSVPALPHTPSCRIHSHHRLTLLTRVRNYEISIIYSTSCATRIILQPVTLGRVATVLTRNTSLQTETKA